MRTVGQILKESRESQFYTLDDIEKSIKIRKELLTALEEDNYTKLPPPTFVQGFIKNYAKFLNLESGKLLAIYRREFSEKKNKPYVLDAFAKPLSKTKFKLTPGKVLGGVASLIIIGFFLYLWFQYHQFVSAPQLSIISPADQLTTDNSSVIIEGKTDPEVKVMVNGQEIPVSVNGDFKQEVNLSSQINKLAVTAISKFGQKVAIERTVYLKR